MKGAVKKNNSPPIGHRDAQPIVAASPALYCDDLLIRLHGNSIIHHNAVSSSETEKQDDGLSADHSSIRASRAIAFLGRARGNRVYAGTWQVAVVHHCG